MKPGSLAGAMPALMCLAAVGLAAGPFLSTRGGFLVAGVMAALAWAARAGFRAAGAAAAVVIVALAVGHARSQALEPRAVPAGALGTGVLVTLEEAPRQERFGWRAVAAIEGARVLLRGRGSRPAWRPGEIVGVSGNSRPLREGEGWLRNRGVSAVAAVQPGRPVGRRDGISGVIDAVRNRADSALSGSLDGRQSSLLRGMVLGDDSSMEPRLRQAMRAVGLGHVVAASGANVAILAALVFGACTVAGAGFRTRLAACALAIALYAPLCGSGPSIIRAAIGGLAMLAAAAASRPASRWHALLLAAVMTLAYNPRAWEDVGWQLSYAAVVGIALVAGPARALLARKGVAPWIADGAAVTFAATAATAPISAAAFGVLSPVSLPVNVIAAPLVAPATWLGMAAAAAGQLDARLGEPFTLLARWPLDGLLAIVDLADRLPFAQVRAGPVVAVLLVAACLGAGTSLTRSRLRPLGLVIVVVSLAALAAWPALRPSGGPGAPPTGGTRVSFLDVGQGDATLFQSRGRSLLVDTGSSGAGVTDRLREEGVERLDTLLVTHAQADHLGAAAEVLRALPVGLLVDGRGGVSEPAGQAMASAAAERGVPAVEPQAGDRFTVGGLVVDVMWPRGRESPGADPNLRCVVLRVSGQGLSVLLGGDAESEVLQPLHPGSVDLLKVSHHGSADPGLPALLEETKPRLAVIEVGAQNSYGHPSPATLSQLLRSGARVMRTDRDGTVRVDLARGRMRVLERP